MKSVFASRQVLLGPVDPKHGDLALLACCYVSGLLDAAVFNNYSVFVGMQTGNTIILCLSTASYPTTNPLAYATTLTSLGCFLAGSALTYHLGPLILRHHAKPSLHRPLLTLNFLTQAILILITAALTNRNLIPVAPHDVPESILSDSRIIAAIPTLAFQSGASIATSRILGFGGEIPVNVLTSTYAALTTDEKLLKAANRPRDRRAVAVICVFVGAVCAAWIMRRVGERGFEACLWVGGAVKVVVAIAVALGMAPAKEAG